MASTDARPVPRKNVAFRVTFPILDADGDLVTGAASLDSEVSKDGGAFADCTNEATEIATSSGVYFLDLTSTEMNADTVAIIVKTATAGAKTTTIVLYPEESGDYRVNVDSISADAITAAAIATDAIGSAEFSQAAADKVWSSATRTLTAFSTALALSVWDVLEAAITTASSIGLKVKNNLDAAITSRASQTSVDAIKAKTDQLTFTVANRVDATGDGALTAAERNSVADALLNRDMATGTDSGSTTVRTVRQALRFLRNKWSISGTTLTVTKEDDSTTSHTATLGTTAGADPVTSVDPAGP